MELSQIGLLCEPVTPPYVEPVSPVRSDGNGKAKEVDALEETFCNFAPQSESASSFYLPLDKDLGCGPSSASFSTSHGGFETLLGSENHYKDDEHSKSYKNESFESQDCQNMPHSRLHHDDKGYKHDLLDLNGALGFNDEFNETRSGIHNDMDFSRDFEFTSQQNIHGFDQNQEPSLTKSGIVSDETFDVDFLADKNVLEKTRGDYEGSVYEKMEGSCNSGSVEDVHPRLPNDLSFAHHGINESRGFNDCSFAGEGQADHRTKGLRFGSKHGWNEASQSREERVPQPSYFPRHKNRHITDLREILDSSRHRNQLAHQREGFHPLGHRPRSEFMSELDQYYYGNSYRSRPHDHWQIGEYNRLPAPCPRASAIQHFHRVLPPSLSFGPRASCDYFEEMRGKSFSEFSRPNYVHPDERGAHERSQPDSTPSNMYVDNLLISVHQEPRAKEDTRGAFSPTAAGSRRVIVAGVREGREDSRSRSRSFGSTCQSGKAEHEAFGEQDILDPVANYGPEPGHEKLGFGTQRRSGDKGKESEDCEMGDFHEDSSIENKSLKELEERRRTLMEACYQSISLYKGRDRHTRKTRGRRHRSVSHSNSSCEGKKRKHASDEDDRRRFKKKKHKRHHRRSEEEAAGERAGHELHIFQPLSNGEENGGDDDDNDNGGLCIVYDEGGEVAQSNEDSESCDGGALQVDEDANNFELSTEPDSCTPRNDQKSEEDRIEVEGSRLFEGGQVNGAEVEGDQSTPELTALRGFQDTYDGRVEGKDSLADSEAEGKSGSDANCPEESQDNFSENGNIDGDSTGSDLVQDECEDMGLQDISSSDQEENAEDERSEPPCDDNRSGDSEGIQSSNEEEETEQNDVNGVVDVKDMDEDDDDDASNRAIPDSDECDSRISCDAPSSDGQANRYDSMSDAPEVLNDGREFDSVQDQSEDGRRREERGPSSGPGNSHEDDEHGDSYSPGDDNNIYDCDGTVNEEDDDDEMRYSPTDEPCNRSEDDMYSYSPTENDRLLRSRSEGARLGDKHRRFFRDMSSGAYTPDHIPGLSPTSSPQGAYSPSSQPPSMLGDVSPISPVSPPHCSTPQGQMELPDLMQLLVQTLNMHASSSGGTGGNGTSNLLGALGGGVGSDLLQQLLTRFQAVCKPPVTQAPANQNGLMAFSTNPLLSLPFLLQSSQKSIPPSILHYLSLQSLSTSGRGPFGDLDSVAKSNESAKMSYSPFDVNTASPRSEDAMSFSPPSVPGGFSEDHRNGSNPVDKRAAEEVTKSSATDRRVKASSKNELQQKLVNDIKEVLRPVYKRGKIDKEDYKDILRKTVPKILSTSRLSYNRDKITKFTEAYIQKVIATKKYHNRKVAALT